MPVHISGLVPLGEDGDPTDDAASRARVTKASYGLTLRVSAVTRAEAAEDMSPEPTALCWECDPHDLAEMERRDAGRALVVSYWD